MNQTFLGHKYFKVLYHSSNSVANPGPTRAWSHPGLVPGVRVRKIEHRSCSPIDDAVYYALLASLLLLLVKTCTTCMNTYRSQGLELLPIQADQLHFK